MKKMVSVLFVLLLCTAFAACAPQNSEVKTVRIGAVDAREAADGAPVPTLTDNALIAQQKGYFEEELAKAGYHPEYLHFPMGGGAVAEAIAANQCDVAMGDQFSQLTARGRGIELEAIASVNQTVHNGIVASADAGIATLKDLEGKKLLFVPNSAQEFYLEQLAGESGLDLGKITMVVGNPYNLIEIFTTKQADAVVYGLYTAYYFINMEIANFNPVVLADTLDAPEQATQSFVSATKGYWEENPEAAKAIVRALDRAQSYAEETAKTDADAVFAAMSKDAFSAAINGQLYEKDLSFSFFKPELTASVRGKWQNTVDYMVRNGILREAVKPEDFFNSSYYDAVIAK